MTHHVDTITDYIIWRAHRHGSFISNLKLQKLLYYAHAWYLALHDKTLFSHRIEAWVHGPVVPSVYRRFKEYGFRNIDAAVERPVLDAETAAFLDDFLRQYLPFDAYALEQMSHQEDPWLDARGGAAPDKPSRAQITDAAIRRYFGARLSAPAAD